MVIHVNGVVILFLIGRRVARAIGRFVQGVFSKVFIRGFLDLPYGRQSSKWARLFSAGLSIVRCARAVALFGTSFVQG